jgi:hypothetical protein
VRAYKIWYNGLAKQAKKRSDEFSSCFYKKTLTARLIQIRCLNLGRLSYSFLTVSFNTKKRNFSFKILKETKCGYGILGMEEGFSA